MAGIHLRHAGGDAGGVGDRVLREALGLAGIAIHVHDAVFAGMGGERSGMGFAAGLCGDGVVGGGGILQLCKCAAAGVFGAGHVSVGVDRVGGAGLGSDGVSGY